MIRWIALKFQRLAQIISRWYNGTEVPYKNYGSLVFLTPIIRYHWTAALLHRFIRWYKFNWFNLWMLIITTLGVLVALIALFK